MISTFLVAAFVALFSLPLLIHGTTVDVWLDPGGSNGNPCTNAQPCDSLTTAKAKFGLTDDATIYFKPGTYSGNSNCVGITLQANTLKLYGTGSVTGSGQSLSTTVGLTCNNPGDSGVQLIVKIKSELDVQNLTFTRVGLAISEAVGAATPTVSFSVIQQQQKNINSNNIF